LDRLASRRCYNRPHSWILVDSWGGHSDQEMIEEFRALGVEAHIISLHTTGLRQPLDVTFMRQYKRFVKRIIEEAI